MIAKGLKKIATIVIVPSTAVETMQLGGVAGLTVLTMGLARKASTEIKKPNRRPDRRSQLLTEKDESMLRSIMELTGKALCASDGEIGQVKDFYFDDEHWAVRYVIADTGSWLSGRLVLISPHAFGTLHKESDYLLVKLTRQQIENSPAIVLHKPVSRQDEEEYNRYYRWPSYWVGGGMWGVGAFPSPYLVPVMEARSGRGNPNEDDPHRRSNDDPHLRSTKALSGYHIQTDEGTIGHVADFLMDDQSWAICHLVVETGHWFSGKQILISPKQIDRVSYEESKVFVKVTKEAILQAPEYQEPSLVAP